MAKKRDKSANIQKKNKILRINSDKLITLILVVVTLGAIIAIAGITFFPGQQNGFAELSLLMYDGVEETYVANNYPEVISQSNNVTVYFMVKNFENEVIYYQVQIKVTQITQNVSLTEPLSLSDSKLLYGNETYEKILSPATNSEKEENDVLSGPYVWGPMNVTLFMNSTLGLILGGDDSLKIVFELWKFDTITDTFQYSGIFTFVELSYT